MNKTILEFFPIAIFFITYHIFGNEVATICLAVSTVLQLLILKILRIKINALFIISSLIIIIFAGISAYFHNLGILKFKVTLINILLFIALFISGFIKKPLIRLMLKGSLNLDLKVWNTLNYGWGLFFLFNALINIYISNYMSNKAWVDFQFAGNLILTFFATGVTLIYLYKKDKSIFQDKK